MKFSTVLAVFAVGFAAVVSGCKYDKAGKGGAANGSDINGQDILSSAQEGSISGASEGKF